MGVEVSQWRRGTTKAPCYAFVAEKNGPLYRTEVYLRSNHNGTMFWSAEDLERHFPKLLSGEDVAGALAFFEVIGEPLPECQPLKECCPSCKSTEIDPCGRGGLRCRKCGATWGAD